MAERDAVQILDAGPDCPRLDIVEGDGEARAVVWPGTGATLRSLHRIALAPGSRTIALTHPSETVYYVIEGGGEAVDLDLDETHALVEGAMAHLDPGTAHRLRAGDGGMVVVGGPCPPDPALYERLVTSD